MSDTKTIVLGGGQSRDVAIAWVLSAQAGCVASVSSEPRTPQQSDKFYAICTDLAQSTITWDGDRLDKQAWHDLLIHGWMVATAKHPRLVKGLEGERVSLLLSTRKLPKNQMSELLDYAVAWATSHGLDVSGEA